MPDLHATAPRLYATRQIPVPHLCDTLTTSSTKRACRVKILLLVTLAWLSGCSWLHSRKSPPPPDPTQIIVTGCPVGALVFIDGVRIGNPVTRNDQTQVLDVAPGAHKVEIQLNEKFVYREDTAVETGERRTVIVKSGFGSNR